MNTPYIYIPKILRILNMDILTLKVVIMETLYLILCLIIPGINIKKVDITINNYS